MEIEKNLVSVIIPAYNRADLILGSVASVLGQSYQNLEVIVVDDGSTDGTEKLFESYPDRRVIYHRYTPNQGACHARNIGAELARGEYIAFQDSDDRWHTEKLEKELDHLQKTGADMVFCGINRVPTTGKPYYYPVHPFDNHGDALSQLLTENRVGTQTMLMRRAVWEGTRFDESFRRYQDWDFALRAARNYKLSYFAEALVDSEVTGGSISAAVASYPALVHLYEAHKAEFDARPRCLARLYLRMAHRLKKTDPAMAARYYKKRIKLEKRFGDVVSCFVCYSRSILRPSSKNEADRQVEV